MKKNKKQPSEFLGAKVLSTFDDLRIKGGTKKKGGEYHACQGQYVAQQCDPPQQQQQIQNQF